MSVSSGEDAIEAILKHSPDLALLDIEMPKVDGFDVVQHIASVELPRGHPPPLIAFVTAYPHFALQAFDTGALDFLCKPVRLARLEMMLERAKRALAGREAADRLEELGSSLEDLREATAVVGERAFWVRNKGEIVRIGTSDVSWIQAEGPYARLHLASHSFLLRNSLASLAKQLAAEGYVQIHRSSVVNRRKVVRVRTGRSGTMIVLEAGTELPVGRKYRNVVKEIVERGAK
jgi:DNA-binding LytR/AlgR family response regulator